MQGMLDVGLSVRLKMRPTTASAVFYFQGRGFAFVGVLCTCFGIGFGNLGFWLLALGACAFSNDRTIWFVFSVSSIYSHFKSLCLKNQNLFEGGFGSSCSLCLLIITDSSAWSA